ncbi:MAG TPA: hypothetical protein VGS04_06470, partial [Nitrososphaerales archaeon]|nr:hypothetical protein [Nitrososphaerales archaeon]
VQNGSTSFAAQAPTSVGPASAVFLAGGPIKVTPFSTPASVLSSDQPASSSPAYVPYHNAKPLASTGLVSGPETSSASATATVPPTVPCPSLGCDSIIVGSGTQPQLTTNPLALNALDSSPFTVEPPDQGLCGGNGFVMETLNQGELQVYNSALAPVSAVVSLDTFFGLTAQGWSSGGDIMCQYDYNNGGHWFVTQMVSTNTEASGGPFAGCFAGVLNACLEGIAVSATSNPMGAYNVYFFNPNAVNNDPGKGYLLDDFAKTATTRDAFLMFYDEFNQNPATFPTPCPGTYGCAGFNGAQEFAFTKAALERGLPVTSSSFNVAYENMGTAPNLYPIPADASFQPAAASCFSGSFAGQICWYQVIPAQTADPSQYDNSKGGTGFMAASLDFLGAGDNRVAAFAWTGLSSLVSNGCNACGSISFGGRLFTTQVTYMDEGQSCQASQGGFCGLAPQKTGPVPLGDNCALLGGGLTSPCPESGIATNGDGTTEASYVQGQIWTSVSTLVTQTFHQHGQSWSEIHTGVTYWVLGSGGSSSSGIADQGYVSASHEDLEFPSVAAMDGGGAVMAFTLSGNGGPTGADNGGFYPSTAYGTLATGSHGISNGVIRIADLGKSPADGFSEYQGYPPIHNTRPRWGDYSQAIFVPSMNGGQGGVLFATEYIQSPNCSDSAFLADFTCGGTRAPAANWGSSINFLSG